VESPRNVDRVPGPSRASYFQGDPIRPTQRLRELPQPLRRGRHPPGVRDLPFLPDGYQREVPVHIKTDTPAISKPPSSPVHKAGNRRAKRHNGFALAAHPDESQGRPPTNPGLQPIVLIGLPSLRFPRSPLFRMVAPYFAGRPPHPGVPADRGNQRVPASFIPDANAIESLNSQFRRAVKARGHFPTEQAALKCLYLTVMSLDPTGRGRQRWSNRWKGALNAFSVRFEGRR
jgi:Transposase, Mutator family